MSKTESIALPTGFQFLTRDGKPFPRFEKERKKKGDQICGFSKSMKRSRQHILLSSRLFHKKYVYKYFDRRKFPKYIGKNQFSLYFREISEWNDPYEKRFYNADYTDVEGAQFLNDHRKVYACCFTSQKDSEPSWKMYVDQSSELPPKAIGSAEREICIQARFDFKALLDALNDYIENELKGDYVLIARPVKYKKKVEINILHYSTPDKKTKDEYFKDFDFSKYLKLLSLKRDAFKYEEEIRFFLIPKNQNCSFSNLICIKNESPKTSKNHKQGKILDKVILDYMSKEDEIKDFRQRIKDLGLDDESIVCSDLMAPFDDIKIGETLETQQRRLAGK